MTVKIAFRPTSAKDYPFQMDTKTIIFTKTPSKMPKHLKPTNPDRGNNEIRITNVNAKTHQELHNIAGHLGVPLSSIIKPKLMDLANSYPAEMKLPPKKD